MTVTGSTIQCHWCGVSLANATNITYLNGNLPVCDLCLMKAKSTPVHLVPSVWTDIGMESDDIKWVVK